MKHIRKQEKCATKTNRSGKNEPFQSIKVTSARIEWKIPNIENISHNSIATAFQYLCLVIFHFLLLLNQ